MTWSYPGTVRVAIVCFLVACNYHGSDVNVGATGKSRIAAWQDFVKGASSPYDDNGHGTHVSGIALVVAPTAWLLISRG